MEIMREADNITIDKQEHHVSNLLKFLSVLSFILAIVFVVLLFMSRNEDIKMWYQTYLDYLMAAEQRVENIDDKFSLFVVIIFLFAFKAVFPIYLFPLSALCAVTSTVFPAYLSIPINLLGLSVLYSFKYYWGKKVGAGGVQTILQKNEAMQYLIERDGKGNPWLLALFRLIPGISVNQVSKLYGAMDFPYRKFLLLSLTGYLPLLISYTFIGRNVFNPLSAPFLVPFILLFILIGVSLLAISKIIQIQSKRRKANAESK
jgi:uncharacterized membrane protein YdjX (TVP38/TMEM64 family)